MEKAAECIVFANEKGGTGKTISCLSIAGYLAKSDTNKGDNSGKGTNSSS